MREAMGKDKNITHGWGCFERCVPPEQSPSASAAGCRLLRLGAVALIVAAAVMLCASTAAPYLWKVSDKNDYDVRYSTNMNVEVRAASMEIDSDNNPERFKTGSGAEQAAEIHDFQIGVTGIRLFGGEKCFIKSRIKASSPHAGAGNKGALMFDLTDKVMPLRFDEESHVWIPAKHPVKDTSFLSEKILSFCSDLPIYWLRPAYQKDGKRRKRDVQPAERQLEMEGLEAAAEGRGLESHAEDDASRVAEEEEGAPSTVGSAYNPENPYHRSRGAGEEGALTFDTLLDHQGICCAECQRGYTHCQRVCEPLRGYWPWPYNHRGCRVACRVIMPCRWWVARILGAV